MTSSMTHRIYHTTVVGFGDAAQAAALDRALNQLKGITADLAYTTGRARITVEEPADLEPLLATLTAHGCAADLPGAADVSPREALWDNESRNLRLRIAAGLPLTTIVVAFSYLPALRFDHWQWLVAGIAGVVVFGLGANIWLKAAKSLRHFTVTSDVLSSAAMLLLYGVSAVQMFLGDSGDVGFHAMPPVTAVERSEVERLYFDAAAITTIAILLARLVERRSHMQGLWQLRSVCRLIPAQATLIKDGQLSRVDTAVLEPGDMVLVGTGERSPVDGVLASGAAPIDASMLTGAAAGTRVERGDWLPAGAQVLSGELIVRAKNVGEQTHAAALARLAEESPLRDLTLGGLCGRFAQHCVNVVAATAVAAGLLWMFGAPTPMQGAATAAAVLLVGAPVALTMARPMAILRTVAAAVPYGVFFREASVIDACRKVDVLVVEKNGHLSAQTLQVTDVEPMPGYDAGEVLALASGVFDGLRTPGALQQVVDVLHHAADQRCDVIWEAEHVHPLGDDGARGVVDGRSVACGPLTTIEDHLITHVGLTEDQTHSALLICSRVVRESDVTGKQEVVVTQSGRLVGVIIISAETTEVFESPLELMHDLGIETYLFTNQPARTADEARQRLGARHVIAELTEHSARNEVHALQKQGHKVAYLTSHDGSVSALGAADVGIQVGGTADGVLSEASLVCVSPVLSEAVGALQLGALGARRIEQYVFCAVAFNAVALPVAFTGWVTPTVAAMLSLLPVVLVSRLVPSKDMPEEPVNEQQGMKAAAAREGERLVSDDVDTPAMGIPVVPAAAPQVLPKAAKPGAVITAAAEPDLARVSSRRPWDRRSARRQTAPVIPADEVLAPDGDDVAAEAGRSAHTWFDQAMETIDRFDNQPAKRPDRDTQRAIAEEFWDEPLPGTNGRRPREVKAKALRHKIKATRAAKRRQKS